MSALRDYTYLGLTQSLCPKCLRLVQAKIAVREGRVFFLKTCPQHGKIEDFVCSDVNYYDRQEFSRPSRKPLFYATEAQKGCPYDCGLCPEHEQHTCIGLAEITTACNLECPMCYAVSGPGGVHWSYETYTEVVDRFVRAEGSPDVLQLSGGEPTIHPEFLRMVKYAYSKPVQVLMVNSNGIRLANDQRLVDGLAEFRDRLEIYLQFDGFEKKTWETLRGESLLDVKMRALDNLAARGIRSTLVCTVQHGLNMHEMGAIVKLGMEREWVRGVSFQPATYSGRHINPADLHNRATMPDVVKGIVAQTGGWLREDDFMPLPCAHPNCHMMCFIWRGAGGPLPVGRLVDIKKNLDLVANTIVYTPHKAKNVVAEFLKREAACCAPGES
ncbi:MAG: radical SAM domain-containing [Planctomycetota bacterium]|nr:MAG: radical SAM domain-containing [Planctomycetota bacterium]